MGKVLKVFAVIVFLIVGVAFLLMLAVPAMGLLLGDLLSSLFAAAMLYALGEIIEQLQRIEHALSQQADAVSKKSVQQETVDPHRNAMEEKTDTFVSTPSTAAPSRMDKDAAERPENAVNTATETHDTDEMGLPIKLDENTEQCPLCGTKQRSGRLRCFHCKAQFREQTESAT